MVNRAALALAAVAVVVTSQASAHAGGIPGFSMAARGKRITFYARGAHRPEVEKVEAFLSRTEAVLGMKAREGAEYYLYERQEDIASATGTYAAGLTFADAGQVHSVHGFHGHEIVHLVAGTAHGAGAFLQEGLAVALGDGGKWRGRDVNKIARDRVAHVDVQALMARFEQADPETAYPLAGSFMLSLIHTHGVDKVAQFFRVVGAGGTDREAAFSRVFGLSIQQAGEGWLRTVRSL
jgi:hypothetical protein